MKTNIVLIGMPGCGKTSLGKMLSEKLKMEFCDVDQYIEKTQKKSIKEIFKDGEEAFRDIESSVTAELSLKKYIVISTGGGVIKRKKNIEALSESGIIIFINRPLSNIMGDVDIETRPLLKDGKEKLKKLYDERYSFYKEYADVEIMNDATMEKVINDIRGILHEDISNKWS